MARIGWILEDVVDNVTQVMSINPNDGASPAYRKNLTKASSSAPGDAAQALVFEGTDEIPQFDFSGTILTKAQYDLLFFAWKKRHPIKLTDDLGRSFVIYLESFEPARKAPMSPMYPWRHTYSATSIILSGP